MAKVARQKVGSSHAVGDTWDIFELFGDSKAEAEPEVETRAPRRTSATVVKSSKFELDERPQTHLAFPGPRVTLTRKRSRAQTSKASKSSHAPLVETGKKN